MNAALISIPIVATAVPYTPPFGKPVASLHRAPKEYARKSATEMVMTEGAVVSKPIAVPEMIVVAGPVFVASAISRTGHAPWILNTLGYFG